MDSTATGLATSPLLHRTVRNSIFIALGTLSTFAIALVFAGLTIRYLGEARAGYLMSLQALLSLNSLLGGLGLGAPLTRRVAAAHAKGDLHVAGAAVGSICILNLAIGVLSSVVVLSLFSTVFAWSRLDPVYASEAFWATALVLGAFVLGQVAGTWRAVFEATQRYDLMTSLATVFGILSGASGIAVLTVAPSMVTLSAAGLLVAIAQIICSAYWIQRLLGKLPALAWDWDEVRPMLRFGGWAFFGSLGGFLFTSFDRLVLTSILGSAALPYYAVPQRFYGQIHTMLATQCQFIFPTFSAFGDQAVARMGAVEDRLRWFVAVLSGASFTTLALAGPLLLSKLVSPEFADRAAVPLAIACAQGFFHAQMIVPYFGSWAAEYAAPNTVAQIMNGTLVAGSAILLVPRYGVVGASVAQLWVAVVVVGHSVWLRRRLYGDYSWNWLQAYISPCLFIAAWSGFVLVSGLSAERPVTYCVVIAFGGFAGTAVLWLVETTVFPSHRRWETLKEATSIPMRHFRTLVLMR